MVPIVLHAQLKLLLFPYKTLNCLGMVFEALSPPLYSYMHATGVSMLGIWSAFSQQLSRP